MRFYRTFSGTAPDDLTAFALIMTPSGGTRAVAIAVAWFGDPDHADAVLAPLRQFGTPLADLIGPMPYLHCSRCSMPRLHGISRYWKSGDFERMDDELIEVFVTRGAELSPLSALLFFRMHGTFSRVPSEATAFAARRERCDIDILSQWPGVASSDEHVTWTREFWNAIAPFSTGVYVNHLDADVQPRSRSAFGSNYGRGAALMRRYDPDTARRLPTTRRARAFVVAAARVV